MRTLISVARAWPALAIAIVAIGTTPHAPWRILGPLTSALLLGLAVRALLDRAGATRPRDGEGLRILATDVLRIGVVVSALRLDWGAIAQAGPRPWIIALVSVVGGLAAFTAIARALGARGSLAALVAIGTSVCGAAAIAAAAPRLRARDEEVIRGVAVISVLGAALSVALVLVHALTGLGGATYALLSGGALHEVAHVVAAGSAVPESSDLALLTKLARVALLPLGLAMIGSVAALPRGPRAGRARVPGLAIAFFAASLAGSLPGWLLSEGALGSWIAARGLLLDGANVALATSMAAIGLRLAPKELLRTDRRTLALAIFGAAAVLALVSAAVALTG